MEFCRNLNVLTAWLNENILFKAHNIKEKLGSYM